MANEKIKLASKVKGVPLWKLAERLGFTDATLSRKLRHEFSEELMQKSLNIIDDIYCERGK